jgi:hypothetical protein
MKAELKILTADVGACNHEIRVPIEKGLGEVLDSDPDRVSRKSVHPIEACCQLGED